MQDAPEAEEVVEVSLVPLTEAIGRLNKILYSNAHESGGTINPVEIMQRSRVMAIEIKTLREFMFDVLAADENGEVNFPLRQRIAKSFFERLADQMNIEAEKEETKQRIAIPEGRMNGHPRG